MPKSKTHNKNEVNGNAVYLIFTTFKGLVVCMTYQQTLDYIHSLGNFSMPAGLERIKAVLQKLNNPQNSLKAIHIAGTNGKGSVSAMLSSVFRKAGFKTGLFISPFIIDFRERIQINGEFVSEADLSCFAERVKATGVKLTEFEFITATAFLYFAERNVDILICETGLGGRFDATNTLENKLAAVITKIGLDHTAVLGDTIEKIAAEKCGILRDCPTITNPYQQKSAMNIIKQSANELFVPNVQNLKVLKGEENSNTFIYNNEKYSLSLYGDYQIENALTVIETVKNCAFAIPYNIIYEGLRETFFPARMEIISRKPLVVLDGAHNPDGALALSQELKKYDGEVTAIIGMMRDKDYKDFLKTTLCHCKNAVAVEVIGMPRTLSLEELCSAASEHCCCFTAEDYFSAIKLAAYLTENKPIFVFGSLYLASAVRGILKEFFK